MFAPLLGGILAWLMARTGAHKAAATLSVVVLFATAFALLAATQGMPMDGFSHTFQAQWIPDIGNISFHLALDGFALVLVLLTLLIGAVAIIAASYEPVSSPGAVLFHLMASITGLIGVFLAADLFLFFVCYEVMLVPMYFLIVLYGHGDRAGAAVKFFIFTQASGLLMLIAMIAIGLGGDGFGYEGGPITAFTPFVSALLLLAFTLAFAVKLPVVPFHTWQPVTYAAAPAAAGIILAGLMSKAGAYGLLRFAVQMFPDTAQQYAPYAMLIGAISIVYGAVLAFSQTNLRKLIAYSSMSHLGFVMMAAFAMNDLAFKGAVMTMVCHAFSVAGLFLLEQAVRARTQTSDLDRLGGLWRSAPKLGAVGLVFTMATLGIPGLGNFVGEFLVLVGVYQASPIMAAIAALGMVLSAIYALWMMQRVFFGPRDEKASPVIDVSPAWLMLCAPMIAALLWLGLFPQPVLDLAGPLRAQVTSAQTQGNTADPAVRR